MDIRLINQKNTGFEQQYIAKNLNELKKTCPRQLNRPFKALIND